MAFYKILFLLCITNSALSNNVKNQTVIVLGPTDYLQAKKSFVKQFVDDIAVDDALANNPDATFLTFHSDVSHALDVHFDQPLMHISFQINQTDTVVLSVKGTDSLSLDELYLLQQLMFYVNGGLLVVEIGPTTHQTDVLLRHSAYCWGASSLPLDVVNTVWLCNDVRLSEFNSLDLDRHPVKIEPSLWPTLLPSAFAADVETKTSQPPASTKSSSGSSSTKTKQSSSGKKQKTTKKTDQKINKNKPTVNDWVNDELEKLQQFEADIQVEEDKLAAKNKCKYRKSCYETGVLPPLEASLFQKLQNIVNEEAVEVHHFEDIIHENEAKLRKKLRCKYRKSCYETGVIPPLEKSWVEKIQHIVDEEAVELHHFEDAIHAAEAKLKKKLRCKYRKSCYETGIIPPLEDSWIEKLQHIVDEEAVEIHNFEDVIHQNEAKLRKKLHCKYRKSCYETGVIPPLEESWIQKIQHIVDEEAVEIHNFEDVIHENEAKLRKKLRCKYRKSCYETGIIPKLEESWIQKIQHIVDEEAVELHHFEDAIHIADAKFRKKLRCKYRKSCYETGVIPPLEDSMFQKLRHFVDEESEGLHEFEDKIHAEEARINSKVRCKYRKSCYETGVLPPLEPSWFDKIKDFVEEEEEELHEFEEKIHAKEAAIRRKVRCKYRKSCYETGVLPKLEESWFQKLEHYVEKEADELHDFEEKIHAEEERINKKLRCKYRKTCYQPDAPVIVESDHSDEDDENDADSDEKPIIAESVQRSLSSETDNDDENDSEEEHDDVDNDNNDDDDKKTVRDKNEHDNIDDDGEDDDEDDDQVEEIKVYVAEEAPVKKVPSKGNSGKSGEKSSVKAKAKSSKTPEPKTKKQREPEVVDKPSKQKDGDSDEEEEESVQKPSRTQVDEKPSKTKKQASVEPEKTPRLKKREIQPEKIVLKSPKAKVEKQIPEKSKPAEPEVILEPEPAAVTPPAPEEQEEEEEVPIPKPVKKQPEKAPKAKTPKAAPKSKPQKPKDLPDQSNLSEAEAILKELALQAVQEVEQRDRLRGENDKPIVSVLTEEMEEQEKELDKKNRCKYRKSCYKTGELPEIDTRFFAWLYEEKPVAKEESIEELAKKNKLLMKVKCHYRKSCYETGKIPDELKHKETWLEKIEHYVESKADDIQEVEGQIHEVEEKIAKKLHCKYRKSCYETGQVPEIPSGIFHRVTSDKPKQVPFKKLSELDKKYHCQYRKSCYPTGKRVPIEWNILHLPELGKHIETSPELKCKYRKSCYEGGNLDIGSGHHHQHTTGHDVSDKLLPDTIEDFKVYCKYRKSCYRQVAYGDDDDALPDDNDEVEEEVVEVKKPKKKAAIEAGQESGLKVEKPKKIKIKKEKEAPVKEPQVQKKQKTTTSKKQPQPPVPAPVIPDESIEKSEDDSQEEAKSAESAEQPDEDEKEEDEDLPAIIKTDQASEENEKKRDSGEESGENDDDDDEDDDYELRRHAAEQLAKNLTTRVKVICKYRHSCYESAARANFTDIHFSIYPTKCNKYRLSCREKLGLPPIIRAPIGPSGRKLCRKKKPSNQS